MTKVVNIRFEKYDVYIGRAGKGQDGFFGNPVVIGKECPFCSAIHAKATETLPCYKEYLTYRADNDLEFRTRLLSLKDKNLGCFCSPRPCHGDVIVDWLNSNDA